MHVCVRVYVFMGGDGDKWRQGQTGVAYYECGSVDRCSVCLLAVGVLG